MNTHPTENWIELDDAIRYRLYRSRTPIEVKKGPRGVVQVVKCPSCQPMWIRDATHYRPKQ